MYEKLAELTGIAHSTLRLIGSRLGYTPTLGNVEVFCRTLDVPFHDMLELIDDPPQAKKKMKSKRVSKTSTSLTAVHLVTKRTVCQSPNPKRSEASCKTFALHFSLALMGTVKLAGATACCARMATYHN